MKTPGNQTQRSTSNSNANQSFYQGNGNNQVAQLTQPTYGATNSLSSNDGDDASTSNLLSVAQAREEILKATKGLGTDEKRVYNAISNCVNRRAIIEDSVAIKAIKGDMSGHELWKCYLHVEYGHATFPKPIRDLWDATKGMGTDEDAVFKALESMDSRAKNAYNLSFILRKELSGEDLEKALDLITTSDSIQSNIYGSNIAGQEELRVSENNLRPLIDSRFKGASSKGLREAMEILYQKPGGTVLSDALSRIETIRGLRKGSALQQYNLAMTKQTAGIERYKQQKEAKGKKYDPIKDNPSPPLDLSKHKEFTGTSAQLRFGKIVGDVFGIDAVFGSLMSPTGGMAGGGNKRIKFVEDGSAVATHGAIHDAAGYLYNCHGIGPGYDYFGNEPGARPEHHLAGQTNIQWWIDEYNKRGKHVPMIDKILNSNSEIGAAFSKDLKLLTFEQKKEVLRIMCKTPGILLGLIDVTNTNRNSEVQALMNTCNKEEKTALADYFYNNNGWATTSKIYQIMSLHASKDVIRNYYMRTSMPSSGYF